MSQAFVAAFDLDDTLYPELEFVRSGFSAVARYVARDAGQPASVLYSHMLQSLGATGRGLQFDQLIDAYQLNSTVPELVGIYRAHQPKIRLPDPSRRVLQELRAAGVHLYLVTDGDPSVQRSKVAALGLEEQLDGVICTWDEGAGSGKPSARGFLRLLEFARVSANRLVYVADNPAKDFIAVNAIGGRTIRVCDGPHEGIEPPSQQHAPTVEVQCLRDVVPIVISFAQDRSPERLAND